MRIFGAEALTNETVREAVTGADSARERVLTHMEPQVRAMVSIRIASGSSRSDAVDEVTQQVLLALADGLARLGMPTIDGLRAFVSGIVAHKVADYLRHRASPRMAPQSLETDVAGQSSAVLLRDILTASGLSPRSAAAHAEMAGHLNEAMDRLRPEERQVIVLAFFDQLSLTQLSEQLGVSRAAVSMKLMRAVRRLRDTVLASLGTSHVSEQ